MLLKFTKMHGIGNDFVVIDGVTQRLQLKPRDIMKIADRRLGVGCDQVLLAEPPGRPDVDFFYRIYNPDGSEAEQCGNGARCFARFVRQRRLTQKRVIRVETLSGISELRIVDRHQVEVDMGQPTLDPGSIPLHRPQREQEYWLNVQGEELSIGAVSMGNPHAVLRVTDTDTCRIEQLGPLIEHHVDFPHRCNVGFMQIVERNEIRLRVHERSAGETLACGSGACAAVVYGRLRGWLDEQVTVQLPGGKLHIAWPGEGHTVRMTGPTAVVFEGSIRL
ncbi:diaminopimelate epimerase [Chromatocurvus halotolerans]|uniref:Diaminopimelate epimerase n=1 Tax=Chromatocurvus halotolerans TaxID=1132028 RepID=A0A4R2KSB4_9GAMM|nr:diaminopimelate epimerase [Chromatocurvus halotolerans]TCO77221.1 diaminopimelate epimerase [Chromatocurvus halotolerans]